MELKGLSDPLAVCEVVWQLGSTGAEVPLPAFVETNPGFPVTRRVADARLAGDEHRPPRTFGRFLPHQREGLELVDPTRERAPHRGTRRSFVAAAGALVESDRIEDARPHFMWLAENDCANVPRDVEYAVVLCGLARLSFRIRPPEAITRAIHDRLLPFAGQFNWTGTSMAEANDLGLGNSAAVLGLFDESDRYFAAALDLCARAGARGMLARAHYDWSRVLAERGDVSRAREHAEIAMTMGEELNMTGTFGVVARGRALLAEL